MRTRTMSFVFSLAALAVAHTGAAWNLTPASSEARATVGYTDRDLADGAAVRAFYERLNVAAAHVCEGYAVDPSLFRSCVSLTLSSAVERINSTPLRRYASSQNASTVNPLLQVARAP